MQDRIRRLDELVDISIDFRPCKDYEQIVFTGHLVYNTNAKTKSLLHNQSTTVRGTILDLSKIQNIDSTGFGVLVNLSKEAKQQNRKLAVVVTDPFIDQLFQISKVYLLFPVVDSPEKALQILDQGYVPTLSPEQY
ncbi:STAS domain-containing protein [Heliorestis convoluta]|uniref:STAS domain-containing protein n=1 Tax=Heliorestis convoluta TaxID=356322 RepID=A0A5Q2MWN8_9FIRM|nr:STAS domain-containing protein [Heliorestis convoluta]QGG46767.1 STAS domain-containing protein [Heliorestis convoluta]